MNMQHNRPKEICNYMIERERDIELETEKEVIYQSIR